MFRNSILQVTFMKTLPFALLPTQPDFDFSTFLFLAQIDEVGPQEMLAVLETWERWLPHLKVFRLGERKGYVLVFLEEPVEREVDEIWSRSPSEGFKHEAIAQTMIMGTLKALMPELGEKECAPVPEPGKPLRRTLEKSASACRNPGPSPGNIPPSRPARTVTAASAAFSRTAASRT